MPDGLLIWGQWLIIALSLLIIACGALMKHNLRGVQINPKVRLAYIFIGAGMLFGWPSILLVHLGRLAWPMVDHNLYVWAEGILVFLGVALELAALGILAQLQEQLHNRAQAARRQA